MAALAVASTAASIFTEVQTANAQNKAISNELQQQNQQVQTQQVAAINDRAMQARKEQGRIEVAAGESGLQLSSGSVENQLMDSAMQQKLANEAIGVNADNQRAANTAEANRYYSDVQKPSIIGAGLRLVSSGVSGYSAATSNVYMQQMISRKAAAPANGG
jgi:hypothetical protein